MNFLILILTSITLSFAQGDCPSHHILDDESSLNIVSKINNSQQEELVKNYELLPKVSFKHRNVTISLSRIFSRVSKERNHVLAFINFNGTVYPRLIYHSNSHGTYRVIDGILGEWYSKGPGQNAISVPYFINELLLNNCIGKAPRRTKAELREFLELSSDHLFYFNNQGIYDESISSVLSSSESALIIDGNGSEMRAPVDVIINASFGPDFSKEVAMYKAYTKAAGEVVAIVYRSLNGELDYTFMKGLDGKIWIAEVNTINSDINEFGISNRQFDVGEALAPRWEHENEIALDFLSDQTSPLRSSYKSNWNYLRELPVIKSWYKFHDLVLPGEE
jgi:hypothetical protein